MGPVGPHEGGIRFQPVLIGSDEGLEVLGGHDGLALLLEELPQVFGLDTVDGLVVAVWQGVQLLTTAQKLCHPGLGAQRTGGLQVDIMRMEGKATRDIVRTRVGPLVAIGGVVDGQHLDDLHARRHGPVDQAAQVAKVTHSIAVLRTQREHRHGDPRQPPRLLAKAQLAAVEHQHLTVGKLITQHPVIAFLPLQQGMGRGVDHHIFILDGHQPAHGVDREHPLVLSDILHQLVAAGVPRADGRMTATDCHGLTGLQLGCRDTEDDGTAEQRQADRLHLLITAAMDRRQIGIAVQVVRQRAVAPLVGEDIVLRGVEVVDAGHHVPLLPEHQPVAILHLIVVDDVRHRVLAAHQRRSLQRPLLAILGLHQQVLVPDGAVLTMKIEHNMQALTP